MMKEEPKTTKKVAMIVAYKDYQDIEYQETRQALDKAGFEVKIASSNLGRALGKLGGSLEVDIKLSDLKVADFDALVFVGGPGAKVYIDDPEVLRLVQKAQTQNKVLAAICIAPVIFAKAGVLFGKKATVWSSVMDQSPIQVLRENGAEYIDQKVVKDGKIITANGPAAAKEFGKTIVEALS